ncbi:hypothetical protein CYMTET_16500 [Cymbomonas tetramitiformis]|uniref:Cysteine-rich protein 1 n=1 Tax=Cymbomonas tetramitiformis TaxID=36881 RepID=A0AAE0GBW6_9CHLO|nr:hypothetical protein CYMTET_16500 [Cymbomonas tetramitiformis]
MSLQADAASWIRLIIDEDVDGSDEEEFQLALKSGQVLCKLLNTLYPGTVANIRKQNMPFMQMENISSYIDGCRSVGVPEPELFMTADLFEGKAIDSVAKNILALKRTSQSASKAPVKAKFTPASPGAKTICRACGKQVYQTELIRALNADWHKICLRCDACQKTLTAGSFVDHDGKPFCKNCYDKHHRPKGYHGGNVSDSFHEAISPSSGDSPATSANFNQASVVRNVSDSFPETKPSTASDTSAPVPWRQTTPKPVEKASPAPAAPSGEMISSTADKCLPYEELMNDLSLQVLTADEAIAKWKSLDIDPSCREKYLADWEFERIFGMTKAAFEKQGNWKKVQARKDKHLF